MLEGLKVQCPACRRKNFVTTDKFDPDKTPNGSMVKCLLPYAIDWLCSSTTKISEMTCPECLAQLAPSGVLWVLVPPRSIGEVMEQHFPDYRKPLGEQISNAEEAEAPLREAFKNASELDGGKGIRTPLADVNAALKSEADKMETVEFPKTVESEGILPNVGKPVHICEICGKECSTALALSGHKRSHKEK